MIISVCSFTALVFFTDIFDGAEAHLGLDLQTDDQPFMQNFPSIRKRLKKAKKNML